MLAIEIRFDLSKLGHNVNELAKIHSLLKKYAIDDDHQIIEANDNYNYVLVIIDAFSRFIQIYPTKSTSAQDGLSDYILLLNGDDALLDYDDG